MTPGIVAIALIALIVAAPVISFWIWWRRFDRKMWEQFFAEHHRAFPGECPVCGFHRYGKRQGFVSRRSVPEPHDCPEASAETVSKGAYR